MVKGMKVGMRYMYISTHTNKARGDAVLPSRKARLRDYEQPEERKPAVWGIFTHRLHYDIHHGSLHVGGAPRRQRSSELELGSRARIQEYSRPLVLFLRDRCRNIKPSREVDIIHR